MSAVAKSAAPQPQPQPQGDAEGGRSAEYLSYLGQLHAAWTDAPQLSVSYRDLSVVFPKPLRSAPPPPDPTAAAAPAAATNTDDGAQQSHPSPPNLVATLAHWATLPAHFIASKAGCKVEPPLLALNQASGIIQPGSMTLVLAPPGHGKSTLLKVLSGRVPASDIRGELLFNGRTMAELESDGIQLRRMASYVGQLDLHFPSLTVRETLTFAAQSSVPNIELLPAATPELIALDKKRADMFVELLGLSESKDVIVGNSMMRGISGGQVKRVTLGEMTVGNARLMCLDEVSTGLDAAVTASIFTSMRNMCRISGCSVVTALLQPTPETYALFDQIILLHEGRVMYHGPRSDIKRWLWQVCGVDVPVDVDEASFLVDFLVNPPMAYEAAKVIAQSASFIEATRPAREAAEVGAIVQEREESLKRGEPLPTHSVQAGSEQAAAPTDPALYQHYATYSQVVEGADAEVTHVRFHIDGADEAEGKQAEGAAAAPGARFAAAESTQKNMEASANTSVTAGGNHLSVPRAKGLGRAGPKHSTLAPSPIKDMSELHSRFKASRWHAELHTSITAPQRAATALDVSRWSAYTKSCFAQKNPHTYMEHVNLCFSRQFKLFKRNLTVLVPRMVKACSIGLFYGLLFFQLGFGDFTEKLAVAMYGAIFAAMTNLSELPVASEARNVISKQLDSGFFPASPYTFAVCACHIPLTIVESICYGTFIYWISGMAPDAGRFFFYLLICFVASNAMAVFYRFVSYITPNPDVAKQLDLPFVVLFIILNGFIIVYDKIPVWLRYWAFWIAPLQWGTKSLSLNEFNDAKYDTPAINRPDQRIGDYYLEEFALPTDFIWKWMGVVYLFGWYVLWMTICVIALKNVKLVNPLGSERPYYERAADKEEEELRRQRRSSAPSIELGRLGAASTGAEAAVVAAGDVTLNIDAALAGERNEDEAASPTPRNVAFQLSALPFVPVTLAWHDLSYSVTLPNGTERQLLHNVSGFGAPGEMTALMGASGAGKTTLMDCIAGRKTVGKLQADILLNGQKTDIHSSFFQQLCGYVEQQDLHIGTSTVEEALRFSAQLRLPTSVPVATQHKFVAEVMELLGLTPFAHSLIGDAAIPGLAPAQLKLVTIGVELVANPSILFLDEPTSGLDAPAAWRVLAAIKRIALTGRNVLCTIHQPAARLFFLFDRLLLLQPGGKTIYFHSIGARGETLVSYFEAASGFKERLPAGVNPAGWMLDVSAVDGPLAATIDWAKMWDKSKLNQQLVLPAVARAIEPSSFTAEQQRMGSAATADSHDYASWWTRYSGVQKRLLVSYWRNGPMNLTRAAIVIIISLLLGLIYYRIRPSDFAGVNSFLAGIYMTLGFGPSLPCSAALPTLFRQRAVYYRESTVRMYDYKIYALSLSVAEFISMLFLMMLYIIPLYFLMDLSHNPQQFWRMYLILFLLSQVYAFISQFYLAYLPNQVSASVVHSIVFSLLFVFGGLLVSAKKFPIGWKWFYYMISTPKAFIAVALGQLSCSDAEELRGGMGCGSILLPESDKPVQVYAYVSDIMENSVDSYGNQVGWLILICFVIKAFTVVGFKFISHLKR